jgi:gliding motility-associated-like protein
LQTLTATATVPVGSTVVWYDAATGGNVLVTAPTLNAVGSITYYAQAVNANNCSSLSRTPVTLTINAAPVAPITGGNQTECEASPLQTLTATATVPVGSTVVWYDAATGGNVLVTAPTLNAVGSITYYAQAVNANNCSSLSRTPVTLTINAAPVAPITGGNQTECEASPLQTLTATATVPVGSTVVWYDAATGGTIVTSPTLNSVGTVTYYAQSTSAENCASLIRTAVTLTIKPLIAVPLTGAVTNPTCAIATGSFSITNFNINNTYAVSPNTGVSISSTGIVTAPAGTYVITTSSNGCTSGNSLSITIDSQPQTPAATIVGTVIQPTCALATGSVVLSGLPSGNWNINPGNISGTTSFTTISGLSAGTYNFTVTNTDGCTSAASDSVIIDAQPESPAAPALGTVTGPTCTIATGSVVLNDLPAGSWTINPGNINGNTTSITISDLAPGTYNYTVTNSVGCTSSASADVIIDEEPSNPTIVIDPLYADCNNDDEITFELNALLPTGTPLTGSWSSENSSANGGIVGSEFSPYLIDVGTYLFTYEAIDNGGCAVKVDLNITVDDECTVLPECIEPFVHNAFSPNGDGVNEVFVINQLDQLDCIPTNTVEIYNRWGILVYETNQYDNKNRVFTGKSEGRVTVDKGAQLPTGTYFYVLNYTTKKGEAKHKEGYLFLNQ